MDLSNKRCIPCEVGGAPLTVEVAQRYLAILKTGWAALENKKIQREFKFKNFEEAMAFVNQVAKLAESEGHHPDIHIFYNVVRIELWTHAVNGLSENDFVLAAKIDGISS